MFVVRELKIVLCAAFVLAVQAAAWAKDLDVSFVSRDGSHIVGTLSMPQGIGGPVPGVFFVHDSGAFGRDEQIGPNAIFKTIAESLVEQGFAVLRYDKRAVGGSTSATPAERIVRENFLDDEAAALAFLRKQPGVDGSNIFGLGHGEGGELLPALALTGAPLRGIVALAPQAQPYDVIISRQLTAHPEARASVERVRASAWFKSTANIDPLHEFENLQIPLLIVQGGADAQMLAGDVPQLRLATQRSNKDATVVLLEGDNHLFQHLLPSDTSTGREYFEPHPVDARLMATIVEWLRSHVR
ncbi:MAG: hypothetical protein NVS9B12_03890 [Vulcanimicrobiaceae bacterium]